MIKSYKLNEICLKCNRWRSTSERPLDCSTPQSRQVEKYFIQSHADEIKPSYRRFASVWFKYFFDKHSTNVRKSLGVVRQGASERPICAGHAFAGLVLMIYREVELSGGQSRGQAFAPGRSTPQEGQGPPRGACHAVASLTNRPFVATSVVVQLPHWTGASFRC